MKCNKCGNENIIEKDGKYICEECGEVFSDNNKSVEETPKKKSAMTRQHIRTTMYIS